MIFIRDQQGDITIKRSEHQGRQFSVLNIDQKYAESEEIRADIMKQVWFFSLLRGRGGLWVEKQHIFNSILHASCRANVCVHRYTVQLGQAILGTLFVRVNRTKDWVFISNYHFSMDFTLNNSINIIIIVYTHFQLLHFTNTQTTIYINIHICALLYRMQCPKIHISVIV